MSDSSHIVQTPEESPGFLLWQTTITWQRLIKKALEKCEITHPQFVIVASLVWFEEKGIDPTQITLVNHTKLDKMTVSNSLRKLAEQGLINRQEDTEDTRAKRVTLTSKGREITHLLVGVIEKIDREFFGALTKSQHKSFTDSLIKLVAAWE